MIMATDLMSDYYAERLRFLVLDVVAVVGFLFSFFDQQTRHKFQWT